MTLQLTVIYSISDFFLALCLAIFSKKRYSAWITFLVVGATYAVVVALEFVRYLLFLHGYVLRYTMMIALAVGIFSVLVISEYRDSRAVFCALMSGSYIMCGNTVAKVVLSMGAGFAAAAAVSIAIHGGLLFLLVRFLLPPYRRLQSVYRSEWRLLVLILAMFYGGMYLLYACMKRPDVTIFHQMSPFVYLLTVYLLMILAFQMLARLSEREQADREQKVLQAGMDALKVEVEEMHRAERRIIEYNHDSRHFVRMLCGMMAEQDYRGVERALAQMQEMPKAASTRHYCGNVPLNGVISYYVGLAERKMIRTEVKLGELPETLSGNEWEFATVIGNLLDNAVQAAAEVQPPEDRLVCIFGRQVGGQTLFEIRNTFSGSVAFDKRTRLPISSRGEGHGLGMQSVAEVVGRWNGTLDCGADGKWFFVRVLI